MEEEHEKMWKNIGTVNDGIPYNTLNYMYNDNYFDTYKMLADNDFFAQFKEYTLNDLYVKYCISDDCKIITAYRYITTLNEKTFDRLLNSKLYDKAKYTDDKNVFIDELSSLTCHGWINSALNSAFYGTENALINIIKKNADEYNKISDNNNNNLYWAEINNSNNKKPKYLFLLTNKKGKEYTLRIMLGFQNSQNINVYLVEQLKIDEKFSTIFKKVINNHISNLNKHMMHKTIMYGGIEFFHIHISKPNNSNEFILTCHQKYEDTENNINEKKCGDGETYYEAPTYGKVYKSSYIYDSNRIDAIRYYHNSIIKITKTGYTSYIFSDQTKAGELFLALKSVAVGIPEDLYGNKIGSLNFNDENNIYYAWETGVCTSFYCDKFHTELNQNDSKLIHFYKNNDLKIENAEEYLKQNNWNVKEATIAYNKYKLENIDFVDNEKVLDYFSNPGYYEKYDIFLKAMEMCEYDENNDKQFITMTEILEKNNWQIPKNILQLCETKSKNIGGYYKKYIKYKKKYINLKNK